MKIARIAGVLTAAVVIAATDAFAAQPVALRDNERPWWTKTSDALVAFVCLATVWFAFNERLLSVSLDY